MGYYSVPNSTGIAGSSQQAMTTTYKTLCAVAASSGGMVGPPVATGLRRGRVYDVLVGTNGTPADNYMEFSLFGATIGTTLTWLGSLSSVSSALTLDTADIGCSAFTVIADGNSQFFLFLDLLELAVILESLFYCIQNSFN